MRTLAEASHGNRFEYGPWRPDGSREVWLFIDGVETCVGYMPPPISDDA